MSAPVLHVFSANIQDGRLEDYRAYSAQHVAFTEAKAPGLLAFHLYVDAGGRRVHSVQLHPDADHMDTFLRDVVAEHGVQARGLLVPGSERSLAYGPLNDGTAAAIRSYGVEIEHHPFHLGGFTRARVQTLANRSR